MKHRYIHSIRHQQLIERQTYQSFLLQFAVVYGMVPPLLTRRLVHGEQRTVCFSIANTEKTINRIIEISDCMTDRIFGISVPKKY